MVLAYYLCVGVFSVIMTSMLPADSNGVPMIAGSWASLAETTGFVYYTQLSSTEYIVQWSNVQHSECESCQVTFMIKLFASGSIEMHYETMGYGMHTYSTHTLTHTHLHTHLTHTLSLSLTLTQAYIHLLHKRTLRTHTA